MTSLSGAAWAAILLLAAQAVAAQGGSGNAANTQASTDHEILQEACGTIKNPQKQSSCLDALVRMEDLIAQVPPRSPAEAAAARNLYMKNKYAAVISAFAALRAATAKQVSFENYGPLIDAAANEVALLRPRAVSEAERQAIQSFDLAIEEYRQAEKNWEAAGKFGLPASSFVVPKWKQARDAVRQGESLLFASSPRVSR